jgi:hypothetical protein
VSRLDERCVHVGERAEIDELRCIASEDSGHRGRREGEHCGSALVSYRLVEESTRGGGRRRTIPGRRLEQDVDQTTHLGSKRKLSRNLETSRSRTRTREAGRR